MANSALRSSGSRYYMLANISTSHTDEYVMQMLLPSRSWTSLLLQREESHGIRAALRSIMCTADLQIIALKVPKFVYSDDAIDLSRWTSD